MPFGKVAGSSRPFHKKHQFGQAQRASPSVPAVRSTTTSFTQAGSGTFTPTLPTRQAGDLLGAFIACDAGTLATPAGWSVVTSVAIPSNSGTAYLYSRTATGSDSMSFTDSSVIGDICATIYAVTGATSWNVTGTASASGDSITAPAKTASGQSIAASAWFFCDEQQEGQKPTIVPPGGLTLTSEIQAGFYGMGMQTGWQSVANGASTGTQTATASGITDCEAAAITALASMSPPSVPSLKFNAKANSMYLGVR
jgi:hypothetical protein